MTIEARVVGPHVRAALIALHLFAITAMALPAPGGGMNRRAWDDPTVQAEFKAWNQRLGAIGMHRSEADFEDDLYAFAVRFMAVREDVLWPFTPYYRYCGTIQSWRMFIAPHMFPERMHIDVKIDGTWSEVYVERDPDKRWLATLFDQDRFRSLFFRYSWPGFRGPYLSFVDWLGDQARRDYPNATDLRVRFWKAPSPTPEQARSGRLPRGAWDDVVERSLAPVAR